METDAEKLDAWHRQELRRLKFTRHQREALLDMLDKHEVELSDLRDLFEKRGWTAEQVFLAVS